VIRGLVVDYGGVLTVPIRTAFAGWLDAEGVPRADFEALLREWIAMPDNPIHQIETGAITGEQFASAVAERLRDGSGRPVAAAGLIDRMFAGLLLDRDSLVMLRAARAAGLRTAQLSNSWAMTYPWEDLGPLLDVRIVSGEVGLRKPDPAIYQMAVSELGLELAECVFVDDLEVNVLAARELGLIAVQHTDLRTTLGELARAVPAMAEHLPLLAPDN
jgi:putative hydrolase of the HAD superfamily